MKLIINIDECNQIGITPLEYALLFCLTNNISTDLNINELITLGFINEDFTITDEGKNIVTPKVSDAMMWFVKTYNEYPHKIGTRVLKSISIDSADGEHCLSKYKHYLKNNPNIGERMYKGLTVELNLRKKGNSLNFFQDIRTWFNQRTWDKYADISIIPVNNERVERI